MSGYKLHYGGQEYKLDEGNGGMFELELRKFARDLTPMMVKARLANGDVLSLLLSTRIPLALVEDNRPKQMPTSAATL